MSEPDLHDRDVRVVVLGHVDHGKSTLIGRLLYDAGALPEARVAEIVAASARRGVETEWSFALDALQDERDQALTIDTTRVWFTVRERRFVIIDAPGHEEFLANAMTGASDADAAILVVDATRGVEEQTRRHAYLLGLLAVPRVIVAINKIDAAPDRAHLAAIERDVRAALDAIGVEPHAIVPLSARHGDNVATRSRRTPWYDGLPLLDVLDLLVPDATHDHGPLRMWVQDVYREGTERIAVGVVKSGRIAVGDVLRIAPAGTSARVAALRRWPEDQRAAQAGDAVGVVFDTPVFVDRGDLLATAEHAPVVARTLALRAFWFATDAPREGDAVRLRAGSADVAARVVAVRDALDPRTLAAAGDGAAARGTVYTVVLRTAVPVALDLGERCAIARGGLPIAAAHAVHVDAEAATLVPAAHLITREERARRDGYHGLVVWLTGLPAAGKTTVAMGAERELFGRGYHVYVLDGDNLRTGLTRDLDFSAEARAENVRRVAEAATLFADAGTITLVSLVSPYAEDRARARGIGGPLFHEVYVRADAATCGARDPKGHYARARRGELRGFTGVDAPYEEPERPDLVLDTMRDDAAVCVARLVDYVVASARTPATESGASVAYIAR